MKVNQITDVRSLKLQRGIVQEKQDVSFQKILEKESGKEQRVQFSKHASQRVQERGIVLNNQYAG